MNRLPLLISLPHAGLHIPEEVREHCVLSEEEVRADGDGGAAEIYAGLEDRVAAFVTTDVARAIVDVNRDENDRRPDGAVKTHTCWNVPVYRGPLPAQLEIQLIERYHRSYHQRLSEDARKDGLILGVDCHTMAEFAPPIAPDPGAERPLVCVSNGDGTCSQRQFERFARCLEIAFGTDVAQNVPFAGGHIIRKRHGELPWVQLELSRTSRLSDSVKARKVLQALELLCLPAA